MFSLFFSKKKILWDFLYCVQRGVDEVEADLLLEDLNAFYQARTARWNKAKKCLNRSTKRSLSSVERTDEGSLLAASI